MALVRLPDGVDFGGEIPNPISRMANVETTEYTFPIRYLFRRRQIDSPGPGRYRGGAGMEYAVVPHDAPGGGLNYVISGKGTLFPMSDGLAGGMPGAPNQYLWVHNNEAETGNGEFATSLDAMPGDKESISWGVYPLMGKDALYARWDGGGGYGDPLERPAADVGQDVQQGFISSDFAHAIYGVVIQADGAVDLAATEQARSSLLDARKVTATVESSYDENVANA